MSSSRAEDQYLHYLKSLVSEHNLIDSLRAQFPNKKTINVLSIGCGSQPVEISALTNILDSADLTLNYVGIDINESVIASCRQQFSKKPYCQFHAINGVQYQELELLLKKAGQDETHIIIMRHPVLLHSSPYLACFDRMFLTTIPYLLAKGGSLIVSIYTESEKDHFLRIMEKITSAKPICAPENKTHLAEVDVIPTFLQDITIECYAERFCFAYMNFAPHLALQVERSVLSLETYLNQIVAHLETMISQGNVAKILNQLFSLSLHLLKQPNLTISAYISQLTETSASVLDEDNSRSSLFSSLSFTLTKSGTLNRELLEKMGSLLLRLFEHKEQALEMLNQNLQLLASRPLLGDLFPQPKPSTAMTATPLTEPTHFYFY